jgi:hypothetical protein
MRLLPGICLSLTLLALAACQPTPPPSAAEPPFTEAQEKRLRQIIREELVSAKTPEGTSLTDSKKLREEIDDLVLAKVEEELAKGTWKDEVGSQRIIKILKRVEKSGGYSNDFEEVDLTGFPTVEGKIKRIVEEFEGINSYSHNNALVKQLQNLGPQAKPQLFKALQELQKSPTNWGGRMALSEALKPLITLEDKELLLEDMRGNNPGLADMTRQLNITEAGDIALEKIRTSMDNPGNYLNPEIVAVAMEFQEAAATPLLLQRLGDATSNGAWLADNFDTQYPQVDLTESLRKAAGRKQNSYESATYARLMLKRGMPEGLAMAADALASKEAGNDYAREQVRSSLRIFANVTGTDDEVSKWLLENRARLKWNEKTKLFE